MIRQQNQGIAQHLNFGEGGYPLCDGVALAHCGLLFCLPVEGSVVEAQVVLIARSPVHTYQSPLNIHDLFGVHKGTKLPIFD